MAAKNRADTQTEINSLLATTGTGDISAADIRATAETAKDSNLNLLETGDQTVAGKINGVKLSSHTLTGGWANYNDLGTQTTVLEVVGNDPPVKIPNDGLGPRTITRALPPGVTSLYDITAQQIDLSDLKVDDMFSFRFDIVVTTSSNSQEVEVIMVFGIGSASEFTETVAQGSKKLSGDISFFRNVTGAIFNDDIRLNPAELRISSDGDCDVLTNGYLMGATLLG